MKKVFLDTNIWMRYFIRDDEDQYKQVLGLFEAIEAGRLQVYTSTIVLLEVHFVAKKLYHIPEKEIFLWFNHIPELRNLTLIEKTSFPKALKFHQQYNVKFADCLIAGQVPKNVILVTFDQDFQKIKDIRAQKPREALLN